jgi:hypothetical protein
MGKGQRASLESVFRVATVGIVLVVAAWAGCSGCQQTLATHDSSGSRPDARVDAGKNTGHDMALVDSSLELGTDVDPDGYPDLKCGGSRRLNPIPMIRGKGMECGKACRQVTFGGETSLRYEVKGELLVYSGGRGQLDPMLYMVDLKSDSEWLVQQRPRNRPGCFYATTDGKRLAYSCIISPVPGNDTAPIQIYDPVSRIEQDLYCIHYTATTGRPPEYIQLGSTGIALQTSLKQSTMIDTFLYRFSNASFTNLSKKYGGAIAPHMSGHRIVWAEEINKAAQIVLYDTIAETKKVLDPTGKNQYLARIEGNKVVWMDNRNSPGDFVSPGNSDIYMHDLDTGKTVAVTTHSAEQDLPDVWGDWVVWLDWRRNPNPTPGMSSKAVESDIYARNMKTGKEIQITNFKGMELRPRIDEGRVFFTMVTMKQRAIFMIDLKKLGY